MSGRRVLALYAALLFGFAGVLCRLFYLASRTDYAARAAAQSTVTLELPARRGGFYDCMGLPLTGLEKRWLALCFPGQENYTRLYACTDTAGQELLYRSRSRAAPFLVEVDRDMTALGIPCYAASRRYAAAPLCPQLLGYLDGEGHGAAGLEKALDALLTGSGARDTLLCPVTAQGTLRTGEQVQHLQADSGAVGVRLTLSRSVQRAAEAVAAQTMTTGCILVLDVRTAALRACVSVPGFDPADPAASLEAPDSPFLNRALQAALNPPARSKRQKQWGDMVFRVGDRIMQTKNNYDVLWTKDDGTVGSGIFNGDVGVIEDIDPAGELLTIRFDDRTAVYTADLLAELDMAYAMTVHKSQGSEYPAVVLVSAPAAPSLMVRGVLYTAITRARRLLVLVGDDGTPVKMAANDRQQRRYSGLRRRLKEGMA